MENVISLACRDTEHARNFVRAPQNLHRSSDIRLEAGAANQTTGGACGNDTPGAVGHRLVR